MTKRFVLVLSAAIFVAGLAAGYAFGARQGRAQSKVVLENKRVQATEWTLAPGAKREAYTRPTDQVIVFLDDASYDAIDASGKKEARQRKAGEVIWHNQGEAAPTLVNTGSKPFRNVAIAVK
jgi:hypothetical protein